MANTALGLIGSIAFLAILGLNALLLFRNAPRLLAALRLTGAKGTVVVFAPTGESNVIALHPRGQVSPAGSALRLAA